jgi:hypothetical protein
LISFAHLQMVNRLAHPVWWKQNANHYITRKERIKHQASRVIILYTNANPGESQTPGTDWDPQSANPICKVMIMPKPATRKDLLMEMDKQYSALMALVDSLDASACEQPVVGEWAVKDVLAHLTAWQSLFMGWHESGLRGETPSMPASGYKWSQTPALNQAIYAAHCRESLAEARAGFEASHQRVTAFVNALSNEDIFERGRYPWTQQNALSTYLIPATSSHYHWALTEIRKGLKKTSTPG